jgi:squalene synthase HpnC
MSMHQGLPTASGLETPSGKNKDTENFPVGSFLIRADLRPHIHCFYRFARAIDDIADNSALEPADKLRRLWRFEEALLKSEDESIPVAVALRESLAEKKISPQHSLDLIRAFKQDATKNRYSNWDELMEYCRYSAAPVGRHVLALHGIGEEAWPANDALCSALQVINHIQDCGDDYRDLDRVYLPEDDMDACGAKVEDLALNNLTPAFRKVLDKQLERLQPLLEQSRELPRKVPDFRLKIETSVIAELADRLIQHLRARDPLAQNPKLSPLSIFFAAGAGTLKALG